MNDKALHKRLTDSINYDAFNGTIGWLIARIVAAKRNSAKPE